MICTLVNYKHYTKLQTNNWYPISFSKKNKLDWYFSGNQIEEAKCNREVEGSYTA